MAILTLVNVRLCAWYWCIAVSNKPHAEYCVDDIYCLNGGTCYLISAIGRKFCEYVYLSH